MDSSLPSWIKDNFKCSIGYVSGDFYYFKANAVPNYASYYWAGKTEVNAGNSGNDPLFLALAAGQTGAGTNQIASQNMVYAIPINPTRNTGTLTGTQSGLVSIGVSVNGVSVFNNAAAPGDTLSSEVLTFDTFGGHPENTGNYHYHAEPTSISSSDSSLIGIALDGYAIYGKKCDNGTASTSDDFTPDSTGTNVLDSLHGHTSITTHFSTATYHYHLGADATAGIDTLMGSSFYGVVGTVSN